jgi:acyl-CoA reductase-like NAD-dependent aldehyde dehydrogenase
MPSMDEKLFGPVAIIVVFKSKKEVLAKATKRELVHFLPIVYCGSSVAFNADLPPTAFGSALQCTTRTLIAHRSSPRS